MSSKDTDATAVPQLGHRKGRARGSRVALGLFAFIGVIAVALFTAWYSLRDPHGPIYAVAPVDGERVALLRQGFQTKGHVHVGVWNSHGPIWSAALFGMQEDRGLVVSGDLLLVRATEARGHGQLHAYDVETGELRWRGPEVDPGEGWQGPSVVANGTQVAEVYLVGDDQIEIGILDRDTGTELARTRFSRGSGAVDLLATDAAFTVNAGAEDWFSVNAEGATPTSPPATGAGRARDAQIVRNEAGTYSCSDNSIQRQGEQAVVAVGIEACGASGQFVAIATSTAAAILNADLQLVRSIEGNWLWKTAVSSREVTSVGFATVLRVLFPKCKC